MMNEYQSLALLTLFFTLAWVPVSVGKMRSFGFRWLASNRGTKPQGELPDWATRCDRAYNNLKDYFPAFVVAILTLGVLNKFDETTQIGAAIFLISRIGHYVSYGLGNVPLRAVFFISGFLANLYLLIKILI